MAMTSPIKPSKMAPVTANPHAREPAGDKVWQVTELQAPFRSKRVSANTAYYARRTAFPNIEPGLVTCTLVGKDIDAAVQEKRELEKAATVPPPPLDAGDWAPHEEVVQLRAEVKRLRAELLAARVDASLMLDYYSKCDESCPYFISAEPCKVGAYTSVRCKNQRLSILSYRGRLPATCPRN